MTQHRPFHTPQAERDLYLQRLMIALLFVLLLSLVLVLRYFNLQILQFEDYSTQSDRNRVHLQPVPPTRGLIYDSRYQLLADNRPSSTLVVIHERVDDLEVALSEVQAL